MRWRCCQNTHEGLSEPNMTLSNNKPPHGFESIFVLSKVIILAIPDDG